jgi:NADH:quinone reductase (non-electrogenic)
MQDDAGPPRVVIVGGGFAGLFAARALRRAPVQVTLIDRAQHHLFQPLLYQCATGILSEGKIAAPLRDVLRRHRNVDCVLAEVTGIDAERRRVLAIRPLGERIERRFDYLIVAAGVEQSYFGHDEFAVFAPGLKTLADALTIRRRVFGAFEMADSASDAGERARWLTFALVGAGPTGVELAGQIRELATKTLRTEFRHIEPSEARVLLFDGGDTPLASFGPVLSAKVARDLRKLGVEQHMGSIVARVDAGGLLARGPDGKVSRHPAGTVLWTAGVTAPALAQAVVDATGADCDHAGRIRVGKDLTIPGHPEIYVLGDLMSLDGLPGVAEVAMQSGLYAGRRIRRTVAGQGQAKPFRYRDLGSAAYICRGRAVVTAGPLHLGGFLGWWMWLFIHIGFLTGFRNRFGAVLSWWLAFTRDLRRERAFTVHEVGVVADVYAPPARRTGTGTLATGRSGAEAGPGHPAGTAGQPAAARPGGGGAVAHM